MTKNFGRKSLNEIKEILFLHGLRTAFRQGKNDKMVLKKKITRRG